MKDRLSIRYNSYVSLVKLCASEPQICQTVVAFDRAVKKLDEKLKKVDELNTLLKGTDSSSATKSGRKKEMIEQSLLVAGALVAYASEIGDNALKADASISASEMEAAKETDVDDLALHIYSLGTTHLAKAADHGLTQKDLDDLKEDIASFNQLVGLPKLSASEGKSVREQMEALFREAYVIVNEQMDNMALRFAKTHPSFYSRYNSAKNEINISSPSKNSEKQVPVAS